MSDRQIVVVATHPDDELLGCGGTVALHAAGGDRVTAVIVCEGETVRYGAEGTGQTEHAKKAAKVLGVDDVQLLGFPDQKLDTLTLTEIISPLERIFSERQPSVVYTQYGGDLNRDHQLVFQALLVASRPCEPYIEAVYAFETASSTEWAYPRTFIPDTWVDISTTLDQKIAAMSCYESEVRAYPHPRSLEALKNKAKAWGNQCGMGAAEVFMTVRRTFRNGQTPD